MDPKMETFCCLSLVFWSLLRLFAPWSVCSCANHHQLRGGEGCSSVRPICVKSSAAAAHENDDDDGVSFSDRFERHRHQLDAR
uniref:Putative secreted protein n=1 Tax=Anopheles marajoara TaxID=58244 RepID=A0A2M4CBE1_9DIPT